MHRLVEGEKLILGGEHIPFPKGTLGHSDADVLIHAICDALLGALALGDIGTYFPDTDARWKNCESRVFLEQIKQKVSKKGYQIVNIDASILLQNPKLAPYLFKMRQNISEILQIDTDQVSVKATTTEGMGPEGRGEAVSVQSICLLQKIEGGF